MREERLSNALAAAYGAEPGLPLPTFFNCIASAVLANPRAHIDALVEAGVLEATTFQTSYGDGSEPTSRVVYAIVQPHKHDWRVTVTDLLRRTLKISCSCGEEHDAPNRLPVEVPA